MSLLNMGLIALLAGSVLALGYAMNRTRWVFKQPVQNERLKRISGYVSEGAMAFLTREFSVLLPFVAIVAVFLAVSNQGILRFQALSFVLGAGTSALAGFIGMKVATAANSRTTHAARTGINEALKVSFTGGSIMGMSVVGLAMFGILVILFVAGLFIEFSIEVFSEQILQIVSGFSLGASSMALFARVGGGIFTKAADVGADLVGKVEAGIPEDDHRNPATIADNVGDNVGDVAGMGADLFESYVGSIVGAMILGAASAGSELLRFRLSIFPLILAASGVLASLIGIRFVRIKKGRSPQKALNTGTFSAAAISALFTFVAAWFLLRGESFEFGGYIRIFIASVLGMVAGLSLGLLTEYYTGTGTRPVKQIVKACETGPATTLITGMGVGMASSFLPIVVIVIAIILGNLLAGLYGVAIAALGMLMTLGIQLAVDAYGPIADNAGGLAEMSEFPPEVREITDELDAVGNTTAAIGKGFAIGSAALTSIILFSAFQKQVGITLEDVSLLNPLVISGLLLGAVIPYLFSSLAMSAIGDAAFAMIEEVRRQFREKPGILQETEEPDYKRCVDISTTSALKKMMLPGIIAIVTPLLVGFLGGVNMLLGLLIGVTASGVVLAIFMANSGGAWDNAKKMIESGDSHGKGSEAHKAAVVGDTVGDPFKDTAGPSLNILIKVMAVVSLVIAPILKNLQ
ncbi:sodium-translocating pyrophosphatase [Salinispira pacifica]|uniref:Putative K(+)-stimulated pyrophosphate-energized sodium pump n=1 Tax=Salinispira pacifica TaxID=1307761 RepID=V5WK37_9SPIO|nr:sodium-translocating pyrophosphatase [Salinispira pacifica]AHC15954.1 Pyrophosphate-energized proton pump [Salinispira pacifica]